MCSETRRHVVLWKLPDISKEKKRDTPTKEDIEEPYVSSILLRNVDKFSHYTAS